MSASNYPTPDHFDAIVIGAGAAGLQCAITAGQRGRRVVVLEHNSQVGRKIAISGGGRCNFTNLNASPDQFISSNPAFCKSALARYTPQDFIDRVEARGIRYHEKKLGQQFCDESSRRIIEMLLAECAAAGVRIVCDCRVETVEKAGRFRVQTSAGILEANSVVIATGGLSFPKLGASDFGYRMARHFGLRITETRPGLVPLTFPDSLRPHMQPLSGVSLPVIARHGRVEFAESMLLTHRGLSGPAILQISSFWRDGDALEFNLLPGLDLPRLLQESRSRNLTALEMLAAHWPRRFAETWCALHAPSHPLSHYRRREADNLVHALEAWPFRPSGTEGYAKAEVTLGGVDTSGLHSKSMEAREVPGLFFIGEVVDVTGWLGGYNFQWAWASGHAAGQAL